MKKLIVVYNPKSGNGDIDAVRKAFAAAKVTPEYISITARRLGKLLHEASASQEATVAVAGGDGTISSVAGRLLGARCKLGIIPVGTLNHFAKALQIPLDTNEAVQTILGGKATLVDAGTVNGRAFINNASIGFYPRSLRFREDFEAHIGKWPAATIGLAQTIVRPRRYIVDIAIDGTTKHFRTPFVFAGNNEYDRSGPGLSERRTLDSGKLALYVIKATQPVGIVRSLIQTFLTTKRHTRDFTMYSARNFTIHTKYHSRLRVACDGELHHMRTPLHFTSHAKALRVIT